MIFKLLTEYNLEFLSLKGGCRGSSKSTLVNMSNCWKSDATAHFIFTAYKTVSGVNGPLVILDDVKVLFFLF